MEFYHLMARGVDKRTIVQDDHDRARFVHDLYVFNDTAPAQHPKQPGRSSGNHARTRLVDIHSFCLMENHYHLLVSENEENGIARFMKKLNMGYTKYFNERYARSGALWQGKYRKVHIERDAHFMYIPFYIHLNPLDYTNSTWRKGGVGDVASTLESLNAYRWSSHLDYLGKKNFPSLISTKEIAPLLGSPKEYTATIARIIRDPFQGAASASIEFD
ncbi:MAG: transposase [Candidatus Pacebacteria bacterium]|nr:transposase [Candidatus Paceibacterota bacterium]